MPSAMARKADVRKVRDYERRRPERTVLYQLVEQYCPRFRELLATQGRSLPAYVQREFGDFLKCGILEHGFLRVRCQDCHDERLVTFSGKRRGFCSSCGARRMVESAALLVDEVLPYLPMRQWVLSFPFQLRFLFASRPEIMSRVLGLVYRAIETHLIQQAGCTGATAKTAGFSLHAGVAARAHQRRKLERLCQYVARPAVATDRLALTPQGNVRYTLKTPYRDDTT